MRQNDDGQSTEFAQSADIEELETGDWSLIGSIKLMRIDRSFCVNSRLIVVDSNVISIGSISRRQHFTFDVVTVSVLSKPDHFFLVIGNGKSIHQEDGLMW